MASPAFVRLGSSSAAVSSDLDAAPTGQRSAPIELICAQVPNEFAVGSIILLWLGSNNNKGQPTPWTQGIRAIGTCSGKERGQPGDKKSFKITIDDVYVFPKTVMKEDLLKSAPDTYTQSLTNASIVGINNYASQVVQLLETSELPIICAMIARVMPEVRGELEKRVPDMTSVNLSSPVNEPISMKTDPSEVPVTSEIQDDDPILVQVRKLIDDDQMGGVMFVGPPGTGKTWYARQVALKLTDGHDSLIREVQFHPSYQYEDFVEGFVPDKEAGGFKLADKHLLQMVATAQKTTHSVVIIIDEFSRTDPARVLGETMTYMEGSLRGKDFFLPSGRVVNLPKNLVFLATMNPQDRSVDEIDAAMERRWAKVAIAPSAEKLRDFLQENGMKGPAYGPIIEFFNALQPLMEIGHAFFRKVRDAESLERLWDSQLLYAVEKRYRFDPDTLKSIGDSWQKCLNEVKAAEKPATSGDSDSPVGA